jgi:hypothetical protein
MIAAIVTAALLLGAKATPQPPAPPEPDRGVVLPMEVADGVAGHFPPDLRRRLEADVAAILQHYARLNVMTSRDIRTMADIDSKRQLSGCDSSCASEIAAALGARFVFAIRAEAGPLGIMLTVSLIDADGAQIVAKGRAQGAKYADLAPQLPFAVDDAAQSLRSPSDPTPAQIQQEARPKLAVLPIRSKDAKDIPKGAVAIVDDAAARAAERLRLRPLSHNDYAAVVKSRGCAENDLTCALPAAAAKGVALGLGVSVHVDDNAKKTIWAALLSPAGAVLARADAAVADGNTADDAFAAAVNAAVDTVVRLKIEGRSTEVVASSTRRLRDDDGGLIKETSCTFLGQFVTHRCVLYPDAFVILRGGRANDLERIDFKDVLSVEPYNPVAIPSGIRFQMRDRSVRDVILGIGTRDEVLREMQPLMAR